MMVTMVMSLRLECGLAESLLRLEVRLLGENNSLLGLAETLLWLESWLSKSTLLWLSEATLLWLEGRLSESLLRLLWLESRLLLLGLESRLAKSLLWLESWLSESLWLLRLEGWLSSESLLWLGWLECRLSSESLLRLESRLSKSLLLLLRLLETTLEGNTDTWCAESESRLLLRLSEGRLEATHI